MAIQGDGKIVAVGQRGTRRHDFALARYNPDGSLDTSFSGDGKQTTDFGADDGATGVAIQGDGKIVAVGRGGVQRRLRARPLQPDGSLDTTFSGDGKQTTDFGGLSTGQTGWRSRRRQDRRGRGRHLGYGDFALARYNPSGTLDTSFSGDGRQTTDFPGDDRAAGVALQADGKIVAVGSARRGATNFVLARYNPNGTLDTSSPATASDDRFGGVDVAMRWRSRPDGKIVAAGFAGPTGSASPSPATAPNGSLDTTFSGDGKQTTNVGVVDSDSGSDGGAAGVALQGDGKIVLAGLGRGLSQTDDFAVARYLGGSAGPADGSLDQSAARAASLWCPSPTQVIPHPR